MNSSTVVTLSLVVDAQAHGLGSARAAPETGALPLPFHNSSADCSFDFST